MNIYICMHAALLALMAWPLAAQSVERDGAVRHSGPNKVRFPEPGYRDAWPHVLQRVETSSDVLVYRFQVAANDQVVAQLGRMEKVKVALAAEAFAIRLVRSVTT